jgi:hypothetical protein
MNIFQKLERSGENPGEEIRSDDLRKWLEKQPVYAGTRRGTWETVQNRFWRKVNKTEGCWMWLGSKTVNSGHGATCITRDLILGAHVFSYLLSGSALKRGYNVLHKCDVGGCVNPDHLFSGTQKENVHDCLRKQRWTRRKLCPDDIVKIRNSGYIQGRKGEIKRISDSLGFPYQSVQKVLTMGSYAIL